MTMSPCSLPPVGRVASRGFAAAGGGIGGNAAPGIELSSFIESLLPCRWELGAEGPEAWDCWSLFRHVQKELFGRDLPRVVVPRGTPIAATSALLAEHPGRALWRQVPEPAHGGAVEMRSVKTPRHVGLWLAADGGLCLHCAEPAGVALDSLLALKALSWRGFRFYQFVGEGGDA